VNAVSNQVLCNGDATTAVSFGSTATGGTIVYNWTNNTPSIGLGATGVGDIASFTAVNTGTTPVTATITVTPRFTNGSVGCNGTPTTFTITVNPTAQVNTVSNQVVCNGGNTTGVVFGSTATGGTVVYNWTNNTTSIGLGASGTGDIASFAAVNIGIVPVTATITVTPVYTNGSVTCSGTSKSFTITVNPTPTVNAVTNQVVCNGGNTTAVIFGGAVAGTTYLWTNSNPSIGLGASGTGNIPAFAAVNTGTAPVTATITVTPRYTNGSVSCNGTPTTFTITVNPSAQVNTVSNQVVCHEDNTVSIAFGTNNTGGITNYSWTNNTPSIGLGASGTGDIGSFTAVNTGTAPVTATITVTPQYTNGGVNCSGTPKTFTIRVNPSAKAQINIDDVIGCAPYRIRDHVTLVPHVSANSQPAFAWYANGVLIGTGATVPNYVITQPGDTVVLKLVAKSLYGCKDDSVSTTIYTIQEPRPSFTLSADTACGPATILIQNTTVPIGVINGSAYSWNFGNGQISSLVQPGSVTFLANDLQQRDTTYYITLTVTTACQTLSVRDSVLIRPKPKALFQPDTSVYCSPANMRFRNNSRGVNNAFGPSNKYIWDWGDGRRDTVYDNRTMTQRYTTGVLDTITVKLYAFNECGVDSFSVDVLLYPATITPSLIVFGQNTFGCAPRPVTFVNNSVGGTLYTIDFGAGTLPYVTNNSNDTISYTYINPGTYTVSMRAQNSCTDTTVYQTIDIYPNPVADFNFSSANYCARDTVRITNLSTPSGIQYTWSMGDGTLSFSGVTNPNYLYQNPGTYTVALIAANTFASGATCRDTAQRQVTILPVPTAVFATNLSTYNCAPFNLTANATPANYSSVEWFVQTAAGITLYSTTGFTFNHTLLTAGNYQLKMIAYNANGCNDSLTTPFTVSGSPIVSYSVSDTVYCGLSATVNFTNTTTNVGSGTLAYQWSVNGVVLSNSATTFTHTFSIPANATAPVIFNVRLVSTASVTGCAPAYERTITLLPAGQVNVPANQVVCDGGVVPATAFTTQNTGGTTTYQWTNDTPAIGLPASGTGNISSFVGVNAGLVPITATIRVTPTFSYGGRSCPGTPTTYTITINPAAQVNQPTNLTVCNGQLTSVNFSTSTTGGVTTYSWTNNNPSIGVLPSNTGNIPLFAAINISNSPVVATISVTPSYTSGGVTCTGSPKTFTITVLPTPQVDQPSNQIVCTGSTVSFGFSSPTTGGIVSYRWTNSNTATGLATSGSGSSVSFISTNNTNSPIVSVVTVTPTLTLSGRSCDGPAKTFTITVNPSGQVNQPLSQVKCNGDLALGTRFSTLLTGGAVSYSWTNTTPAIGLAPFGSGDIDSFRVVNTGTAPLIATITVTPTFINGGVACPGQPKSFTITVNPSPNVNPLPNLQYCDGNRTTPISFTSPASGGSITYTWSNSNSAIGLPLSGVGAIPSFTATNSTAVPIVATITVTPSFSNGGVNCGGIPRTFTITVLPLPQTLFRVTPDSACAPMVVTFSNLTQFADTYQWSVNGVPFSTAATPPPMVLTQAGTTFVFTLVAGNTQGGCGPTSFSYTVKTLPTPRSQFSLNGSLADTLYACKQLTVQATNTSYLNTPGNVVGLTYQWYVNGQLLSTGLNPQFQLRNTSYTRDTLIKVKLVAASSSGCIDSAMRWVRLYPEPLASFAIVGGAANCARPRSGLVKTVQNLSQVKPPAVFTWTVFNRTSPLPQQHGVIISNPAAATPTFTFPDNLSAADSTYEIYLLVKSADGCTKDTSLTQVVYARPIVNFRMTDSVSCTGSLNVSFLDLSVSPTSSITTRLWNFDDGTATSTLPAVSHIYSNYGVYRPWLYVSNARGCVSDTMRKRVVVFGPPVADFSATTPVCLGSPVTFVNTSQLGWGSTQFSQVLWDFGGGVTSTVFSPTYIYTAPGIYTVTLTILSDSSCVIRKKSMQITVIGKPKADFSFNSRCVGSTVQFTNLSTAGYADGGFSTAQWNFGNGLQSIQLNPTTVYNTPGSYPVQLIVGGVSCPQLSDTIVKTLVVTRARPDSIYPLIYATRLNRFTMQALPGGVNYLWTPPIGLIQPNRRVTDAYYLSNDPSRIDYTITIKDSSGCVNHDKQEVWIFDKPNVFAPTAFTPNRDNINDVFIPIYVNIATLQSFRIFSRWGVKIFETNDLRKGWDGTINGQTAPLETYSWVVECFDVNGNKLIRKGMVTLLRY
jgi:gliding motility-associated-like protein